MSFTADTLPDDGWDVFRIRPTVKAKRITGPFEVTLRDGKTHCCRDGWLVVNESGDAYPVSDAIFESVYERV
jgi:hypothetical protein